MEYVHVIEADQKADPAGKRVGYVVSDRSKLTKLHDYMIA
jgi:hypothetical protein